MTAAVQPDEEQEPQNENAPKQGPLLDEEDTTKVAKAIVAKIDAQKRAKAKLGAICRRNRAWRRGTRGVRIVEETDRDEFRVTAPAGSRNASPVPNRVDSLLNKTVALLTADRPMPDVSPSSGDDEDVNAAEFSTDLLVEAAGDNGVHDLRLLRWALNVAGTFRSAFVYLCVDPTAGGRVPVEIKCHRDATMYDPQNPGACLANPMDPNDVATEDTAVTKYLHSGNQLLARKAGAVMRWIPKVVPDVVTSETVWLHPPTCRGIDDADEVTVGHLITLRQAKALNPSLKELDEAKLREFCRWRPSSNVRGWLSAALEDSARERIEKGVLLENPDKTLSDDNLVFAYHHYVRQSEEHPRGAYVCILNGNHVADRYPWSKTVGEGDAAEDVALDLPLAQFRWKDDPIDRDPMGISGAEDLGAMDEVRAAQLLAVLEWLYRFNRPIQYLPAGSPLQGKNVALARETQNFVTVNMDGSGRPISEDVPQMPALPLQIYDAMGNEMDDNAGVPKSLQGLTQQGVRSGAMQNQQIEQALQTLAPIFQNAEDGMCRYWRLVLQLWYAFYDQPRLAKVGSEGDGYKRRAWTGADLKGARDVRMARGSFTALTQSVKRAMAAEEFTLALQTKDPEIMAEAWQRYQDATSRGLSSTLGMNDDPVEQRVRSQIASWKAGPPAALAAQEQAFQQAIQAQQQAMQAEAQLTGQPPQPMPAQQGPMQQAAMQLFAPVSSDALPGVAKVRLRELVRAQQSVRYQKMPPAWRQGLDQALQMAQQAAGVQTTEQQAQNAQQGQQQALTQQVTIEREKARAKAEAEGRREQQNDRRDTARQLLDQSMAIGADPATTEGLAAISSGEDQEQAAPAA